MILPPLAVPLFSCQQPGFPFPVKMLGMMYVMSSDLAEAIGTADYQVGLSVLIRMRYRLGENKIVEDSSPASAFFLTLPSRFTLAIQSQLEEVVDRLREKGFPKVWNVRGEVRHHSISRQILYGAD